MINVCISGVIKDNFYSWDSFFMYVEPYVDNIFVNIAIKTNISYKKNNKKIIEWNIENNYSKIYGSKSSQFEHYKRERDCLIRIYKYIQYRNSKVLLTRPDIVYGSKFPFEFLNDKYKVYIPYGDDHNGGINDQMIFGNLENLLSISEWFDKNYSPEYMLFKKLKEKNTKVLRFWYEYALLRERDIIIYNNTGPFLFSAFNHNTRIWGRVINNVFFNNIVDAKTMCTKTIGHVKLPSNVPCISYEVKYKCSYDRPKYDIIMCSKNITKNDAVALLCNTNEKRPQATRNIYFKKCSYKL